MVDDDERVRGVTRELLTVAGFAVDEAETGEEALRRVRDHPDLIVRDARHPGEALLIVERRTGRIDLLVTDVVMPEMSGHLP